jgi:hypothetical protein
MRAGQLSGSSDLGMASIGRPETVGCGVVGDVMRVNIVIFDKMGGKACLTVVNRDNVVSDEPLEVCPQKPLYSAHEFNSHQGGKEDFKFMFSCWVFREVHKIVDIET